MIYPKIPLAQSILEIFRLKGIQHIVISPGSRNAPLTIGFANNPNFKCFSVVDERCAAFFALGMAQQLQKPVAVVCTSGSALLNYYPAVAEAFYSQIPLIVISADRPQDKIDIGDGQTIRQENVFANHILFSANLTENASVENDFLIEKALFEAQTNFGPVHINAPFEEPLYETVENLSVKPILNDFFVPNNDFILSSNFIDIWNNSKKKLVLVGDFRPNSIEQKYLDYLAKDESVLVLIEKNSNLHHANFVDTIDTLITPFTEDEFKEFQPDLLLTFGGMVVSKRVKAFLRKYKPKEHWHVDELRAYDTFGALSQHFVISINTFFEGLFPKIIYPNSTYQSLFLEENKLRKIKHEKYVSQIPFSDLKVFEFLSKKLPQSIHLQVSNSSAIRYLQLVSLEKTIEVFCNRGTSGIDGSTSTAIGASLFNEKQTIFISGDISFFYDSNALWNQYIPKNFKIILLNNSGGGIFRILPGHAENEVFNTFFETSHNLNASHLAKMYDFEYYSASNDESLEQNWNNFITNDSKPSILEIFTPEKINDKILKNYF